MIFIAAAEDHYPYGADGTCISCIGFSRRFCYAQVTADERSPFLNIDILMKSTPLICVN